MRAGAEGGLSEGSSARSREKRRVGPSVAEVGAL